MALTIVLVRPKKKKNNCIGWIPHLGVYQRFLTLITLFFPIRFHQKKKNWWHQQKKKHIFLSFLSFVLIAGACVCGGARPLAHSIEKSVEGELWILQRSLWKPWLWSSEITTLEGLFSFCKTPMVSSLFLLLLLLFRWSCTN